MNHKRKHIIIIDISRQISFYRLNDEIKKYRNKPILLVPVHQLHHMQNIENIFCISSIAKYKEGYLYPNIENIYLAKNLEKRNSPKTIQTVGIAINVWIKTNCKVTIITDSAEVEKAVKEQGIDYDFDVIRL